MKQFSHLTLVLILFLSSVSVFSQEVSEECTVKYNLFRGDFKTNNYDMAYDYWIWTFENCPTLSVNIYKNGMDIAEYRYKKATGVEKEKALALVKRVVEQRIKYYPDDDLGKVYSDYAEFMESAGASDDEIFSLLDKAFKVDPTRMGIKSMYRYFQGVIDRNKDTNPQYVFDTYDELVEAVGTKMDNYSRDLEDFEKRLSEGQTLSPTEERKKNAYETNLAALGQIEGGLDDIIISISTCDRLVPLYTKQIEENRGNAVWLKRAVSRMYTKECTTDPLYYKLVEAYVKADPSPSSSIFYANILFENGESTKALKYYQPAVEQETDNFKKAGYLFTIAQEMARRGNVVEARNYAQKALSYRSNLGRAYLLISTLYAGSANSCGNDEFSKRMVYVAALDKAYKAKAVDPSISSLAERYISSYVANIPTKKLIFVEGKESGSSFRINCWIGETVRIP
jgi:tetratricopeptide (TPR) repeat protein